MIRDKFDIARSRTGQEGTVLIQDLFPDADYLTSHGAKLAWGCIRPGMTVRPHHHDDAGLFIFVGGKGEMVIGDEREPVGAGDAILAPPLLDHSFINDSSNQENLIWIGLRFVE